MICAYCYPFFDRAFAALEELAPMRRALTRAVVMAASLGAGWLWYDHVYCLPKLEYNKVHPYTSWIPITVFMILRNLTPTLRTWSMGLYAWLGCITLETCEGGGGGGGGCL